MSIFGDYENDSELMLILKQLAFGTAIGMAFLGWKLVVWLRVK
jgi:hypothetical protein